MPRGGSEGLPFEAVLRLLSREDPEGLLASGAPADEYSDEAADLAGSLRVGRPVTRAVLVDVWERWFGPGNGYVRRAAEPQLDTLAAELDALREKSCRAGAVLAGGWARVSARRSACVLRTTLGSRA